MPAPMKMECEDDGQSSSLVHDHDRNSQPKLNLAVFSDDGIKVHASVRRKVDLRLIPLLYLCSFSDRGNIANARVAGMGADLKLDGIKYQLAAAVFFIPYSLAEIPCNVILKLVRPSIWIPFSMFAWGFVMLTMAFVTNYHGLLAARVCLGLTEAGLAPGVAWYITQWYRREDQARAISLYFSSATLAGAFGGFLAFAIEKMDRVGGLHGWAWIFLVEGLFTIIVSLAAFYILPDYPATANFLTPHEKEHLITALADDTAGEPSHFEIKFIWDTLRDPLSWLQSAIFIGMVMPLYAFALFLPTIIKGLGYSTNHAQLLTIPPYAFGCLFTTLLGILSDRARLRSPFVMSCALLAIIGYTMLYLASPVRHPDVGYAGSILAACGVFPAIPLLLAWASANAGASLKKGVVIGMMSGFGNLGGICSSFIYRTQDSPRFHLGHGVVLGFLAVAFISSAIAAITYRRLNRMMDSMCQKDEFELASRTDGTAEVTFRCRPFQYSV